MKFDMMKSVNQKGFATVLLIFGVLILAIVGGGVYYFYQKPGTPQLIQTIKSSPIPQASPSTQITNWKTYTSTNLGFLIKYPEEMETSPNERGNNSSFILYGTPLQQHQTTLVDGMVMDLIEVSDETIFKSQAVKTIQDAVNAVAAGP